MKKLTTILLILLAFSGFSQVAISDLSEASSANASDLLVLVQSGSTKKIQFSNLGLTAPGNQYEIFFNDGANGLTTDADFTFNGTRLGLKDLYNNAFIGYQAGLGNTTGHSNVFLGYESGLGNTTGAYGVYLGFESGESNTIGNRNVYIGYRSGRNNTTGDYNTYLGYQTGTGNVTGDYNVNIGYIAGTNHTSGNNNVYVGSNIANANNSGSNNTMIGHGAGTLNQGSSSVLLGYNAGYNETGSNKLYIDNSSTASPLIYGEFDNDILNINGNLKITGDYINWNDTSLKIESSIGTDNMFIGEYTATSITSGANNVIIGQYSGSSLTSGNQNIALGNSALMDVVTGINNTAIGAGALNNTTGSGNVALGSLAGYNETGSNKLYIDNSNTADPLIWGDFSTDSVELNADVNITGNLHVDGTIDLNAPGSDSELIINDGGVFGVDTNLSWDGKSLVVNYADNSVIGYNAGLGLTASDNYNVIMGYQAGQNGGSDANVFIGYRSGLGTTNRDNVFIGYSSGYTNATGVENVYIGKEAGYSATGSDNVFLGHQAGFGETGSDKLVIETDYFGSDNRSNALIYGDFANDSVRINGTFQVGDYFTWNDTTLAVGYGINNMAIGTGAGTSMTNDQENTFLGVNAGLNSNGSLWNVFVGKSAGQGNTTGQANIVMGREAGKSIGAADNNVYIGHQAGENTTGGSNIFIGFNAGQTQVGVSNKLFIDNSNTSDPLIYGDFANDTLKFNAETQTYGTVGINTVPTAGVDFHLYKATGNAIGRIENDNASSGVLQWQLYNDSDKELSIGKLGSSASAGTFGVGSGAILNRDGNLNIIQDGSDSIKWYTDETDSQSLAATVKMSLDSAGNLDVARDVTVGHLFMAKEIVHGFFAFEDSSVAITINTQNVWEHITNASNNLFIDLESDEMSISGDTIEIDIKGHYLFNWNFVVDGGNSDNIEIRVYNITDGAGILGKSGTTTRGSSEDGISSFSYDINGDAGDQYILQIRNKSDTDNVTMIDGAVFLEMKHFDE